MAYFDRERRELVVRVVYDGPATAGKTANLRSIHASFGPRATEDPYRGPETTSGRTLYFDWLELLVGQVDDWPLRCQVLTVPGQLALAERRFHILRQLDAAVLVCESTPKGVRAAQMSLAFLDKILSATGNTAVPVLVQANKQDLPAAIPPAEVASRLALHGRRRVIAASAVTGDGVRETFLAALGAARDALRARVQAEGPEALPADPQSAARLYEAMTREADAPSDPALVRMLEEAMGLIHGS